MLAHHKLIKIAPHPITSVPTLNFDNIIGSIFLVKSLLLAVLKECSPISKEAGIKISALKQEIDALRKQGKFSYTDFAHIDSQFYAILYKQNEFQGLNKIIAKEKLYLDRMLRLFLKHEEDCKSIIRFYERILGAMQSNNVVLASSELCELARALEEYAFKAEKYYPEFFT